MGNVASLPQFPTPFDQKNDKISKVKVSRRYSLPVEGLGALVVEHGAGYFPWDSFDSSENDSRLTMPVPGLFLSNKGGKIQQSGCLNNISKSGRHGRLDCGTRSRLIYLILIIFIVGKWFEGNDVSSCTRFVPNKVDRQILAAVWFRYYMQRSRSWATSLLRTVVRVVSPIPKISKLPRGEKSEAIDASSFSFSVKQSMKIRALGCFK